MVNYGNGKIYKIVSAQTDKIYVGSSAQTYLCKRWSQHVEDYRNYLEGKCKYLSSFELLQYHDAKIILIEKFPCGSSEELRAREQYHIELLDCVNKKSAYAGSEKTIENLKRYRKSYGEQYRKKYKVELAEKNKEYRAKTKDKKLLQDKQYRDQHKEEIATKKKEWYENHKDEINQRRREQRKKQHKQAVEGN